MNIYLVTEDGERFCIKAQNMIDAVNVCLESYLEDRKNEEPDYIEEHETKYYHEQILESCSLVGELKN